MNKTRILIIDDSAIVRKLLSDILSPEPDLEIVATSPGAAVALEKIELLQPDVLTLDIEMPGLDGLTFLKQLMGEHPLPVVVISSLGQAGSRVAIEALQCGAVEVVAKPGGPYSVADLSRDLPEKIRAAARARLCVATRPGRRPLIAPLTPFDAASLVAIGASTGGTEALRQLLSDLPENSPPLVVVQHIPAVFSKAFAERLNACCRIQVKEAGHDDEVRPGTALIAPGGFHLRIKPSGPGYRVELDEGPLVCYQRPSVDVLFESVAQNAGRRALGILLTGMGTDGAAGLLKLKEAGARTIAQDEASCVVFGMPKEAIRLGAAGQVLALGEIANALITALRPRAEFAGNPNPHCPPKPPALHA